MLIYFLISVINELNIVNILITSFVSFDKISVLLNKKCLFLSKYSIESLDYGKFSVTMRVGMGKNTQNKIVN